ncbi:hypothetical protein [Devosia sp.]|uniref:hypothetical protein n=1 Tax=Devosia sp. TaxID=1871048 RepID=UPI003A916DE9
MPRDPASPMWVVTSYFNPTGSRNRLENYRAFRRNLAAPLLTVELSAPGSRQLGEDDAEILLSRDGEPFIWQKERLINIGIAALPAHVEFVAWVDCDVIFSRHDWLQSAISALQQDGGLLHLFREVVHLPPGDASGWTAETARQASALLREPSLGLAAGEGRGAEALRACYDPASRRAHGNVSATGMALAARRKSLEDGLYDAAIVGGGDAIMMCAALGLLDEGFIHRQANPFEFACIVDWAERARRAGLFAPFRAIEQTAYHMWHGDLRNRKYGKRHHITAAAGFDPRRHLRRAENGTWSWAEGQDALAQGVRDYFIGRREG